MNGHSHSQSPDQRANPPIPRRVAIGLGTAVGAGLLLALVGMALLWPPHGRVPVPPGVSYNTPTVKGAVVSTRQHDCPDAGTAPGGVQQAPIRCQTSQVQLTSGRHRDVVSVDTNSGAGSAVLHAGDDIVLATSTGPNGPAYEFFDYQRQSPLLVLGLVFALVVVAVARWRGVGALVGLVVTWLILSGFVFPALLQDRDPLAVALVASAVVMCVVLFVAHGIKASTATALLGTLVSLGIVGALSVVAIHFTHLTGLSDEVTFLQTAIPRLRLDGLLTAGIIIGSLGVLNDVTVTQASAVWEIHDATPLATTFSVYRAAMRVGRDHIASSVYTLVLAYAGASLPLLLLFDLGGRSFGSVITSEIIAQEVVRTLVGGIGLVASVPITTALAALTVTAATRSQLRDRSALLGTEA